LRRGGALTAVGGDGQIGHGQPDRRFGRG
jgi:hypothetical protein